MDAATLTPPVPKTLDWREPPVTHYAVAEWLKIEQIKHAITRGLPTLQGGARREEPIALVGFGPSLHQTWEKVRDYPFIMSCSGSHKFLLERGIVPTWHLEVDPRAHKVDLLGEPHTDTHYLPASTCSPKYIDHLVKHGATVTLWHIFDGSEAGLVIPPGTWSVTGGCDVGLRMLSVSAFMGFRDLHVFGLDGSYADDGHRHAATHPNGLTGKGIPCEYGGVTYRTTPGMLKAARETCHELDMLGDAVTATFYGEGLTQHMVRDRVPAPKHVGVAVAKPELISAAYRDLNMDLHRTNLAYGVGGGKWASIVLKMVGVVKSTSVLDYGCGKGYLAQALPFPIWEYDPAIPGKDATPRPAEIVICADVLEHVEPDRLLWVLEDLRRVTKQVCYVIVDTQPSTKSLADGRNAHLILEDRRWWELKLRQFFTVAKVMEMKRLVHFILAPRGARGQKGDSASA